MELKVKTRFMVAAIVCMMIASSFCAYGQEGLEDEGSLTLIPLEEFAGISYEKEFAVSSDNGNYIKVFIDNKDGDNDVSITLEEPSGKTSGHYPLKKGSEYTYIFPVSQYKSFETLKLFIEPVNYAERTMSIIVSVSQVYIADESVNPITIDSQTDNVILVNLCEYIGTDFRTFFTCSDNADGMMNVWIDNSKNDVDIYAIMCKDGEDKKIKFDIKAGEQITYKLKTDNTMSIAGDWKMVITTENGNTIDVFVKVRQYSAD